MPGGSTVELTGSHPAMLIQFPDATVLDPGLGSCTNADKPRTHSLIVWGRTGQVLVALHRTHINTENGRLSEADLLPLSHLACPGHDSSHSPSPL